MPTVFVVLFYAWLIIGTAVFIHRRIKGVPIRSAKKNQSIEPVALVADSTRMPPLNPVDDTTPVTSASAQIATEASDEESLDSMPVDVVDTGVTPPPTVVSLVTGIQMPCDLMPYMGAIVNDTIVFDRVVFSTTTHGFDAVCSGIEEELERLGFQLEPAHNDRARAISDDGEIGVRITPPPSGGIHERYPDATAGAVMVELTSS